MYNRQEKKQAFVMLLRADFFTHFKNIAFFEIFENHQWHMQKLLKTFCFYLNVVEELDRTGLIHFVKIYIS